ncbi:MAG TPA: plastocyanin/azurin family copper-binding protein [Gemmatimonadaceae bacterium]|nr:plastocyanin/azurin family copper-binding protein [Gemmatimonadaceae bacterium]
MRSASFDPTELSVSSGAVVTFENTSGITHDVVFDAPISPGVTNIGTITTGSRTRTFSTAGTWNFRCTLHGGMVGKIVVP